MVWQQWFLMALFAISTVVSVSMVGKQRTPTTPNQAAIIVILNALTIWVVISI